MLDSPSQLDPPSELDNPHGALRAPWGPSLLSSPAGVTLQNSQVFSPPQQGVCCISSCAVTDFVRELFHRNGILLPNWQVGFAAAEQA